MSGHQQRNGGPAPMARKMPPRPRPGVKAEVKAEAESYQEIKLYGCDVKDEYHIMRFLGHPPRLADIKNAQIDRQKPPERELKVKDEGPEQGAGSVYKKKDKIGKVKRVFTKRERDMPWDMSYLEKDHKTNSYKPETLVGTKEELPSHYCLVAKRADGNFQILPVGNWYKFARKTQTPSMTLEEAEKQMKNKQLIGNRWILEKLQMREDAHRVDAELVELDKPRTGGVHASDIEDEDEDELDRRANRKKVLAKKAAGFRKNEREDMEYEENFTDDDEGAIPTRPGKGSDDEDDTAGPPPPGLSSSSSSSDEDGDDTYTKEGKALKAVLKKSKEGTLAKVEAREDDSSSGDELGEVIRPMKRPAETEAQDSPKRQKTAAVINERVVCELLHRPGKPSTITDIIKQDPDVRALVLKDPAEKAKFQDIVKKCAVFNKSKGEKTMYSLKPDFRAKYSL